MGWELKNANEDVDISNCKIDAFEKLPLGSYFEDILNDEKHLESNPSRLSLLGTLQFQE